MIPLFKPYVAPESELMPRLRDVLYSGYLAEGESVAAFEREFGAFIGNPNVLAVSSCTAALHMALLLSGVGPGTEVISTPMTAEPTNLAILHAGGKVAWADVRPDSGNIDVEDVARLINERTKAIVVVDYGGEPVDTDMPCTYKFDGPRVIEDAAHALGAYLGDAHVGTLADFTCFSFQAIKTLTTGDGGALACFYNQDVQPARELRWFGIDRKANRTEVDVKRVGYKYNMNNITAEIGRVQLGHIQSVIDVQKLNGAWYNKNLADIPGLTLVMRPAYVEPSYWFYTFHAERRDDLMQKLKEQGVDCGLIHRRNDLHSVFADSKRELPGLDKFWSTALHIPCGWHVTPDDREYIAGVIKGGW